MIKYFILFSAASLLFGCVSTGPHIVEDKSEYTKKVKPQSLVLKKKNRAHCPDQLVDLPIKKWSQVLDLANSCVKSGNWENVEKLAKHLSLKESDSPWGSYYMSIFMLEKHRMDHAEWLANLAIKKAPEFGMLYFQRARVLWEKGEKELAFEDAHKALSLDDRILAAHQFLGEMYLRDLAYQKASEHLQKVYDSSFQSPPVVLGLAESRYELRQYELAAPLVKQALDIKQRDVRLYYMLATSLETIPEKLEDTIDAYTDLRMLIQNKKTDVVSMAQVESRLQDLKKKLDEQKQRQVSSVKNAKEDKK